MARKSTGAEALEKAQLELTTATTIEQFQIAQAVVMPLVLGLTLLQTSSVLGKTPGWVARARIRFINDLSNVKTPILRGGRRNSVLPLDEEIDFVSEALKASGPYKRPAKVLKNALEKRLQRTVAVSTAYKLLARVETARRIEIAAITRK